MKGHLEVAWQFFFFVHMVFVSFIGYLPLGLPISYMKYKDIGPKAKGMGEMPKKSPPQDNRFKSA